MVSCGPLAMVATLHRWCNSVKPNVFGRDQAYPNLMTEDLQAVHQKLSLLA